MGLLAADVDALGAALVLLLAIEMSVRTYSTVRHFTGGRALPGVVASLW